MRRAMKRAAGNPLMMFFLLFIITSGLLHSAYAQSSMARDDTVKVLQERIRVLEERIETLENQIPEMPGAGSSEENQALLSALKSQLTALAEEVESLKLALDMQQERMARVKVSGEERVRFMNIDTDGAQAIGAYDEELKQETTFKYYLRMETSVSISENLIAGARLRLTNVDKTILDLGPEYLSRQEGSAFLKYARKEFNGIIGAYDIHLTPFTLMRWDQEDNPEGGGEAGGGCLPCGGIAGAIPRESLEELTPVLSFEGARLNGMVGDFVDVVAFYARPLHPGSKQYRQHIVGARAKLLSYHRPSTSFRHLGLTVMTVRDEASSIFLRLSSSPPALENNILGVDVHVPVSEGFLLRGEWTYTEVTLDSVKAGRERYDGHGLLVGFKLQYPVTFLKLRCSYVRLDSTFQSAYRAVSYVGNRHGIRASLTLEIPRWNSSVSAFAKIMKAIDAFDPEKADLNKDPILLKKDLTETFYTGSLGLSYNPVKNVLIRPSVIYRGSRGDTKGIAREVKDDTYFYIGELVFTLHKDNEFIIRYQYIKAKDKIDPSLDYSAETLFTLFSLRF
ncbi:MAG: hypothetical protein JSV84_16515 [Gemmatimonadota bacterium]|nr:MAG: hypothetical protein JSV84_16515 [Gemmatimonadota bacterium]